MIWLTSLLVPDYDPTEPLLTMPMSTSSDGAGSPSFESSMRSRTTFFSEDSWESKLNASNITTRSVEDYSWMDHLLGVFCVKPRSKTRGLLRVDPAPPPYEDREVSRLHHVRDRIVTNGCSRPTSILPGSYRSMFFQMRGMSIAI